jgi:hypothetical protein
MSASLDTGARFRHRECLTRKRFYHDPLVKVNLFVSYVLASHTAPLFATAMYTERKRVVHSRHQPLYYIRKRKRQTGQTPVSAHYIERVLCIAGGTKALSHRQIILKCLTDTQGCYFFLWPAYHV